MTTFVIDAELEAGTVSVVVGSGAYTVTGLPTESEFNSDFFTYPAGLVIAGGKEVWEYDEVVPIDDYAALGPRETPPDALATPWPEDEMVSADMHFNLGMHVRQNIAILEDHENRLRDLEFLMSLLKEFLPDLIVPPDADLSHCSQYPNNIYVPGYVKNPNNVDFGTHPSVTAQNAWCQDKGGFTNTAGWHYEFPLNEVTSIPMTMSDRDFPMSNVRGSVTITQSSLAVHQPDQWTGFNVWFSKTPNGDPLKDLNGNDVIQTIREGIILYTGNPADTQTSGRAYMPTAGTYYYNMSIIGYNVCAARGRNIHGGYMKGSAEHPISVRDPICP